MFSDDHVVRVEEVSVYQGQNSVLDKISFEIEKGEFVFLIGTSGSGKTSFIKSMLGAKKLKS